MTNKILNHKVKRVVEKLTEEEKDTMAGRYIKIITFFTSINPYERLRCKDILSLHSFIVRNGDKDLDIALKEITDKWEAN